MFKSHFKMVLLERRKVKMSENNQTRVARRQQKKAKKSKKPTWKKIFLIIGIIILAIGVAIGGLFTYYIATAPDLDATLLTDAYSSKYYDKDGEEIGDFAGDEKRTKIEFDDLPDVLIDAVTATEDVRFFSHPGIDLRRIGGAVIANITRGFGAEGASTITQQVIEKSFLSPDKKLKLKVQEQWLALKLEREYSKEQIMEMYLNKIFYGSHSYGVAEAAKNYFGKTDLHDLTLVEAAILAGLPQRPTAYNPYENPDLTAGRVDTVLKLMVRHNKITQAEADEAREVDISSLLAGKKPSSMKYNAFIQQVEKEVKEKLDGADIYADGLKIYTTLDTSAQDHVEFLLSDSEDNPINYPDDKLQSGMVILDTSNGAIRAIGGGRNHEAGTLNYATQNAQQLGSTAKPLVSFGPAIEYNKISTYHQLNDDEPYPIAGTDKVIRNWNRQYQGWMSARYALSQSLNVPTVKLLEETGYENARKFGEGLGIKFHNDTVTIGDAIGGTETRVSPLQVAGAYRAFGNEGIYNEPYAVTKVEFPDGKVVDLKPEPEAAMSDYTAYMVTDMLKTAITEGTGRNYANIPGLAVAGKTTSVHFEKGSPDAWFSGYTTNYTIAVWSGHSSAEDRKAQPIPDTSISQTLFKNAMIEISKDIETADFVKPDSVVEVEVEKGSNPAKLPSKYTPSSNVVTELFVKGHEPGEVSEKFDELDPVSGLQAKFDEDKNAIQVNWDYDEDLDVSFEVSARIDGGEMSKLSSTEDMSMEISEVETGTEYEIQVVAVDGSNKSDPKSVKVKVPEEEEEEVMVPVESLQAKIKDGLIDVSWKYNGPAAVFEVDVNGQKQTVQSNGIEISNISAGQTYTITVTPIGKSGSTEDVRGEPRSITETIPAEEEPDNEPNDEPEEPEPEEEPENQPENNEENEQQETDELNE